MSMLIPYMLNLGGRLFSLATPQVMGIVNLTPDSFYPASRVQGEKALTERIGQILREGGSIVDIGACSTRPGGGFRSADEEREALRWGLEVLSRSGMQEEGLAVSVDTFRADIARMCVEEYGVDMVNDVSGGRLDKDMFPTVARLRVPYVLTYSNDWPEDGSLHAGEDPWLRMARCVSRNVWELHELGVNDIVLDPGFGFGKTLEENYALLASLCEMREFDLPLLVGVSRKSMIRDVLGCTSEEALNGTTALHMAALLKGCHVLRVHDVKACVEAVRLAEMLDKCSYNNK